MYTLRSRSSLFLPSSVFLLSLALLLRYPFPRLMAFERFCFVIHLLTLRGIGVAIDLGFPWKPGVHNWRHWHPVPESISKKYSYAMFGWYPWEACFNFFLKEMEGEWIWQRMEVWGILGEVGGGEETVVRMYCVREDRKKGVVQPWGLQSSELFLHLSLAADGPSVHRSSTLLYFQCFLLLIVKLRSVRL